MAAIVSNRDGRRQRAERHEAAVIDALLDLFRDGELRPGAAAIAARAGVSERTVFRLFDDLEALAAVTIERQIARVAPLLAEIERGGSREERITALVGQRLAVYTVAGAVFRAGQMRAPLSPAIRQAFARRQRWSQRQIERLFRPELAALGPSERAELILALDAVTSLEALEYLATTEAGTEAAARGVLLRTVRALLRDTVPAVAPAGDRAHIHHTRKETNER